MRNVQFIVNPTEEWDYDFHILFLFGKGFFMSSNIEPDEKDCF